MKLVQKNCWNIEGRRPAPDRNATGGAQPPEALQVDCLSDIFLFFHLADLVAEFSRPPGSWARLPCMGLRPHLELCISGTGLIGGRLHSLLSPGTGYLPLEKASPHGIVDFGFVLNYLLGRTATHARTQGPLEQR